ncbi:MAG: hypothetical protein M3Z08_18075 [Chloroflexota bacterium]|nr:hypothetical protein [Chloroflexota bacterium]
MLSLSRLRPLLLKRLVLDTGRERLSAMVGKVGQVVRLGGVTRVWVAAMARVRCGRG